MVKSERTNRSMALTVAAALWLSVMVLLLTAETAFAADVVETEIRDQYKSGRMIIAATDEDLKAAGYETADLLKVTVNGKEYIMPYITDYNDVAFRTPGLASREKGVMFVESGGNFLHDYPDFVIGTSVRIEMQEKGGYAREYNALHLDQYSSERSDFPELSDAEFANFRMVSVAGIREGVIYRTACAI